MNSNEISLAGPAVRTGSATRFQRWARTQLMDRLGNAAWGGLTVVDAAGRRVLGTPAAAEPHPTVTVHDPRLYTALLLRGTLGAAESFMDGHWDTDDLPGVIRVLVRNLSLMEDLDSGWFRITGLVDKFYHRGRRNTKSGSRENIAEHYDLGNDFYSLWLDETMTYSSAVFERPGMTLAEASTAKYDRLCRKLGLDDSHHVLEIGTGWGGFALHAAGTYGCRVTTTTISREQHRLAGERIRAAGLEDRVELLTEDYRDLSGQYDRLVSIEMIEAVGHDHLDLFFKRCGELLKPDGLMALQAITIADRFYEAQTRSVDFIKRYIFPGSCLVSPTVMCAAATRTTDLGLVHLEDITPHYAETLRQWRLRFLDNIEKVRALGYPERFMRMWEFYLAYCEGAFAERYIGNVQAVFAKPLSRRVTVAPPLPETVPGVEGS